MKKQYRSEASATVHETACDLHEAGAMDMLTRRKFDKMCLTPVLPMKQGDIRVLHRRRHVKKENPC